MTSTLPKTEEFSIDAAEKQAGIEVENVSTRKSQEMSPDEKIDNLGFTEDDWRKIKRRIDRRLVVTCGVLYVISVMDRTNVGAAAIAGLTTDLDLTVGYRYVSSH